MRPSRRSGVSVRMLAATLSGVAAALLGVAPAVGAGYDAGPGGGAPVVPSAPATESTLVPGEVIVRFDDPAEAASRVRAWGGSITLRIGLPGLVTARFDEGVDTVALARDIAARPGVRWAEPNRILASQALSNDARIGEQWATLNSGQLVRGLTGIAGVDSSVAAAWDYATGGDAIVAIGDSGISLSHPDLAANVWANPGETGNDGSGRDRRTNGLDDDGNGRIDDWRGWDFLGNDNDPSDEHGHGTHVAGTIGAVGGNGVGIAGISHRVKLMPLKIGGSSRIDGSINSDAAAASMLYASAKGAKVYNGSFTGSNPSRAQEDAIAASPNTLFVFAAGNSGTDVDATPTYPCSFNRDNVICVGSITNQGALSSFSNYGVKQVDLGAPGSTILSTSPFRQVVDDPFEVPIAGRWTVRTLSGPAVPWGISPNGDGSKSLRINDGNGVTASTVSGLVSKRFDLGTCVEPVLELEASAAYSSGAFDVAITEDANPSNEANWLQLTTGGNFPTRTIAIDLTNAQTSAGLRSFAGKTVAIVLVSKAPAGNTGKGPVVDNLSLSCKPNVFTGQEYEYLDGTSMAAPQVAGAAGLVANQFPGASVAYLRSALLTSTTAMPSLTSKTVSGGRLNVFGALDTQPPTAFGLGAPAGGATVGTDRPTFSWNGSSDVKTGLARYELVIDGNVAATSDAGGLAVQPGTPLAPGVHSWRVDAVDHAGLRTSSETRSFTFAVAAPPAAPAPLGPPLSVGKLGKVTKAKIAAGLSVKCTIGEVGRCRVAIRLSRADAKKLGLEVGKKSQTFLVGKASSKVGKSGKATVKVRPSKATARAIKRGKKKVTFLVEVVGVDAEGHETVSTLRLRA